MGQLDAFMHHGQGGFGVHVQGADDLWVRSRGGSIPRDNVTNRRIEGVHGDRSLRDNDTV